MSLLDGTNDSMSMSGMVDAEGNPIKLWNYSAATTKEGQPRDDFKQTLQGILVDMKEVQATKYQSTELDWWFDKQGKPTAPKMDIELAIQEANGNNLVWHIKPGSSSNYKKFSLARKAMVDEVRRITKDPETNDITKLLGKEVYIKTEDMVLANGDTVSYGSSNPRPWEFKVVGDGDASLVRFGKEPKLKETDVPQVQTTKEDQIKEAADELLGGNIPF